MYLMMGPFSGLPSHILQSAYRAFSGLYPWASRRPCSYDASGLRDKAGEPTRLRKWVRTQRRTHDYCTRRVCGTDSEPYLLFSRRLGGNAP